MNDRVAEALLAVAAGDRDRAVELLSGQPAPVGPSILAVALLDHLTESAQSKVYDEPAAFTAFIDGGGNVALYERLIAELSAVHSSTAPATVADIGCGDGRVTAAVLAEPATVDLIESSRELLSIAIGRLERRGVTVIGHELGVVDFLDRAGSAHWDLAQATFALHNLSPSDRGPVLAQLADRCSQLLIAEFDVPPFADRSPEHAAYAAERYEQGLAEYADPGLVARGFLMPVLVGQFDPTEPRHTFEQPVDGWVAELETAGFGPVEVRPLVDYWWAPAKLIDARADGP